MREAPQPTFKDLSGKPEVTALIAEAVARVNQGVPEAARIREFALFDKELQRQQPRPRHFVDERGRSRGCVEEDEESPPWEHAAARV